MTTSKMITSSATYYTCVSADLDVLSCGSSHRNLRVAQRCSSLHRKKHGLTRSPELLPEGSWTTPKVRRKFPMSVRQAQLKLKAGYKVFRHEVRNEGPSRHHWTINTTGTGQRTVVASITRWVPPSDGYPSSSDTTSSTSDTTSSTHTIPTPTALDATGDIEPTLAEASATGVALIEALNKAGIGGGVSASKVEALVREHVAKPLADVAELISKLTQAQADAKKAADAMPTAADLLEAARDAARDITPRAIIVKPTTLARGIDIGMQHRQFEDLLALVNAGVFRIFMPGPAGGGKTYAGEALAKALDVEFFVQPPIADKFEILGFNDATGVYQMTEFYRWCKAKPGAVLVLDELDACNPNAILAINTALANGYAIFPEGRVDIPSEHICLANGNTWGFGATIQYVGRTVLDGATLSRFTGRIDWQYDGNLERVIALAAGGQEDWVRASQRVRTFLHDNAIKLIWSPRDTVAYCKMRASGMTHKKALSLSAVCAIESTKFDTLVKDSANELDATPKVDARKFEGVVISS